MYAKIFKQIFDSSLANDLNARRMFIDLLVLAESDGVIDMTYEAIAARTRVPIDEVKVNIGKLCQPDPNSRSHEHQGSRLIPVDPKRNWGWQIVNYESYRGMRDENARRDYMRTYMQERRKSSKQSAVNVNAGKQAVNTVNISKQPLATDSDSEKDTNIKKEKQSKKKYRLCVYLFDSEYEKLIQKYKDKSLVDSILDKLDAYKQSKGVQYESDYAAIISWVADAVTAVTASLRREEETAEDRDKRLRFETREVRDLVTAMAERRDRPSEPPDTIHEIGFKNHEPAKQPTGQSEAIRKAVAAIREAGASSVPFPAPMSLLVT